MGDRDSRPSWVRDLGLLGVIIADLVGYTGAGIGIGYLAWTKLAAPWWVLLLTSVSGLALAMYQLYLMSRRPPGGND